MHIMVITAVSGNFIQMIKSTNNLFCVLLAFAPLISFAADGPAKIRIPQYRPVISISIDSNVEGSISALNGRRFERFCFLAEIAETELLQASPLSIVGKEIDVYVGLISPAQRVRTWTPTGKPYDPEGGIINEGILPYAQKYIPRGSFFNFEIKLESICYRFESNDTNGLYSVFVWLVKGGQSLAEPRNWIGTATAPFFLTD